MLFEWDSRKRDSNLAKHGLDFVRAAELFDGRRVVTRASAHKEEARWLTVGLVGEAMVAAVWTYRGSTVRIISFRRARNVERQEYRAHNG